MSDTEHDGEGQSHYKNNGKAEVIELMEDVAVNILKTADSTADGFDVMVKKAMNASYGMKHLARAGTKSIAPVDQELLKAENYIHRARTGEWIQK